MLLIKKLFKKDEKNCTKRDKYKRTIKIAKIKHKMSRKKYDLLRNQVFYIKIIFIYQKIMYLYQKINHILSTF